MVGWADPPKAEAGGAELLLLGEQPLADGHRVVLDASDMRVVVVTFIRSKATGHTSSTDPSSSLVFVMGEN